MVKMREKNSEEKVTHRKPWCKSSQWSSLQGDQTGETLRSNKDTGKRRQQALESDGLVLVEAMHIPLKRRKLDYRNWLQFSRKKLQEPGGWKMSAIWRNWRKENWKPRRSGVGKREERWAFWQGYLGRVRCLHSALILGCSLHSLDIQ